MIFTRPPFAPTLRAPAPPRSFAAVKVTVGLHSCCNGSQAGPELQRDLLLLRWMLALRDTCLPSVRGARPKRGPMPRSTFDCANAIGDSQRRTVDCAAIAFDAGIAKSMSGSTSRSLRRRRLRRSDEFARCRFRVVHFERDRDAGHHDQEGRECVRRRVEVTQCCHQGDKRAANILELCGLGALHESPKP